MLDNMHPGLLLILAGALLPFFQQRLRMWLSLVVPIAVLLLILSVNKTEGMQIDWLGMTLVLFRVDALSRLFLIFFALILSATMIFCYRQIRSLELSVSFIYAGSAMGVVLAADILSLFIFWELMAIASTLVIWSQGSARASAAGMRYLLIHIFGGVLLMVGLAGYYHAQQSLLFDYFGMEYYYCWLILAGFLINAGAPPLSAWIADAYPESSFSGMVLLSTFTTKAAVYALVRAFPGTEILIAVGLWMIFYGIVYALLENDMRRLLAYGIVNQVGFMVCGVGIGTAMALNGVVAHVFNPTIALLIMSAGAVLYMTGRRRLSELGGLIRSMPFTAACCVIGALSISSFPLTSGFVSKSMVVKASADEHLLYTWLLLQAGSVGVFLYAGLKFPWFVFVQKASGPGCTDPPANMCVAMLLLSGLCLLLGLAPDGLYAMLPYPVDYVPYTADHVLAQLQLLMFSGCAFFLLLRWMQGTSTISLDFDWFYRCLFPAAWRSLIPWLGRMDNDFRRFTAGAFSNGKHLVKSLPQYGSVGLVLLLALCMLMVCLFWYL